MTEDPFPLASLLFFITILGALICTHSEGGGFQVFFFTWAFLLAIYGIAFVSLGVFRIGLIFMAPALVSIAIIIGFVTWKVNTERKEKEKAKKSD